MFENLSSKQLARAAALKERIEILQNELDGILGGSTTTSASSSGGTGSGTSGRGKGPISAAGLARIKAAQKARWANFRKAKDTGTNGTTASAPAESKPKRVMSAAAKAKIRAAAKKRWAKAKASGRNSL